MENVNEILLNQKLINSDKYQEICGVCGTLNIFPSDRNYLRCTCGLILKRIKGVSKNEYNSGAKCRYCNDNLVIPYHYQVSGSLLQTNVVCDSCPEGREFLQKSRTNGHHYKTYTDVFGRENNISWFARLERLTEDEDLFKQRKEKLKNEPKEGNLQDGNGN